MIDRCRTWSELLLLGLVLISVSGCSDSVSSSKAVAETSSFASTVNVVRIARSEKYNEVASYFGTLEPSQTAPLGFAKPGKVMLLPKSIGQTVAAGEIIAQYDISNLENQRGEILSALDAAKIQQNSRVVEFERQLAVIDSQIENATLVAPFSGTLSQVDTYIGHQTPAGVALVELIADRDPVVRISLAESTARAQFVGRRLEIVLADEVPAQAIIQSIHPIADPSTRTREVVLEVVGGLSSSKYALGSTVKVSFDNFREEVGFWLPLSALHKRSGGLWAAMVLEPRDGRTIVMARTVEVLFVESAKAYVRGVLRDGDQVVVDGTHRIVAGQEVVAANGVTGSTSPLPVPEMRRGEDGTIDKVVDQNALRGQSAQGQ